MRRFPLDRLRLARFWGSSVPEVLGAGEGIEGGAGVGAGAATGAAVWVWAVACGFFRRQVVHRCFLPAPAAMAIAAAIREAPAVFEGSSQAKLAFCNTIKEEDLGDWVPSRGFAAMAGLAVSGEEGASCVMALTDMGDSCSSGRSKNSEMRFNATKAWRVQRFSRCHACTAYYTLTMHYLQHVGQHPGDFLEWSANDSKQSIGSECFGWG